MSITSQTSVTDSVAAAPRPLPTDIEELQFEIGLWLSGLESFLNAGNHTFVERDRSRADHDWTKEARLVHSALLLCSKLASRLLDRTGGSMANGEARDEFISIDEVRQLSAALRDSILLNEALVRAEALDFGVWKAWSNTLSEKLISRRANQKFIRKAEFIGEQFLPERLSDLISTNPIPFAEEADLKQILPRFARVLKWLSVVARMLRNDEPLKPALLIFARVSEQTRELIDHINNRLSRFPDEEAELFGSLDGASYTAAIEVRKVYEQELSGIVTVRPSLSIYARMETAYSLLNDSFEQILTGFARLIDPKIEVPDLFPGFNMKLKRSLNLRKDLWTLLKAVQSAEKDPSENMVREMQKRQTEFLEESVHFLFYKDKESIERFAEALAVTVDGTDLVGTLHRYGTYLETLFGQVNMRTALADHPFDPSK